MRALITGGRGFVGVHLERHLRDHGDDVMVADAECDVTELAAIGAAVADWRPDAIYHLAARSHVGESWQDPSSVLRVNVLGTANVLAAARALEHPPMILVVSSAEVYGHVDPGELPIDESCAIRPLSPYAASKAAAEVVALQAARGFSQRVVVVRPFNHIGPGQSSRFAIPAFASRILGARSAGETRLVVGNLATRRDLTDVRDVVAAYRLLVVGGIPGEIYNVASGTGVAMAQIVELLEALAGVSLSHEVDDKLLRPTEVPVLFGDASKLRSATGWAPSIPLERTLADVLSSLEA